MRIAFVVEPFFAGNRIFALNDPVANRDGCQEPFARLRATLAGLGLYLDTQDICPVEEADAVLFFNAPSRTDSHFRKARTRKLPIYVLALESEHIHPANADMNLLSTCKTVFTFRDGLADGKRYLQVRYPQKLRPPRREAWAARRFACMISGNKWAKHPSQLYGARLKTIQWYERNAPERLDLYGPQWDMPVPSNIVFRAARRLPIVRAWLAPRLRVWRGVAEDKESVISRHRFCYCYENFSTPNGWITEKLFDAMFGGAVPVYWGAAGTGAIVPKECFINAAEFDSIPELDRALLALTDQDCDAYTDAARSFLMGPVAQQFSIDQFVKTIADRLAAGRNDSDE